MSRPLVSLITVTFNSADVLKRYWAAWPRDIGEWIVVDNASTDGSAEVARSLGAQVIQFDENVGFATANNFGVREAVSSVIGFVNPDVMTTRDGLQSLAARVQVHKSLVAPQLINEDGSLQENGRGAPYPIRKLAHMFMPKSRLNKRYVRHVDAGLTQVVWVMGAALFMTKETFFQIDGWDPGYFIYYEDSDICLRALAHGIPTLVDGDVRWEHGWSRETAKGVSPSIWRHELRSGLRFYRRHPSCVVPIGARARVIRTVDRVIAVPSR